MTPIAERRRKLKTAAGQKRVYLATGRPLHIFLLIRTNCISDRNHHNWSLRLHLAAGTHTLSGARSSEFESSV